MSVSSIEFRVAIIMCSKVSTGTRTKLVESVQAVQICTWACELVVSVAEKGCFADVVETVLIAKVKWKMRWA